MAIRYDFLEADDVDLIEEALTAYHPRLISLNCTVRAIMAEKLNRDEEMVPCLKGYGGVFALAKISVIKPRGKIFVKHDAEIVICKASWTPLNRAQKLAVLDHELTHLEPNLDKEGHPIIDEDGRPLMKLRPDDFIVWGFHSIIAKHKENSMEGPAVRMLATHVEQDFARDAATFSENLSNRRAAMNETEPA